MRNINYGRYTWGLARALPFSTWPAWHRGQRTIMTPIGQMLRNGAPPVFEQIDEVTVAFKLYRVIGSVPGFNANLGGHDDLGVGGGHSICYDARLMGPGFLISTTHTSRLVPRSSLRLFGDCPAGPIPR